MLDKGITGPERGPKDATVTIVEFGDLQCPACKAAQPTIEALVAAEPTARFVFQNFPLEMHNWAAKGAAYADCVGRASNDAFWKFVAKTYETQSDITAENADEKLTAIADGAGVKGADIAACAVKPETKARVDASLALGKSVDVTRHADALHQWTQDWKLRCAHVGCVQEPGGVRGERSKIVGVNHRRSDPARRLTGADFLYFWLIQISGVAE